MSKWSDRFNELPIEVRHIASMVESEMRINQLEAEKLRLKRSYDRNVKEINQHIANLKRWIEKGEAANE